MARGGSTGSRTPRTPEMTAAAFGAPPLPRLLVTATTSYRCRRQGWAKRQVSCGRFVSSPCDISSSLIVLLLARPQRRRLACGNVRSQNELRHQEHQEAHTALSLQPAVRRGREGCVIKRGEGEGPGHWKPQRCRPIRLRRSRQYTKGPKRGRHNRGRLHHLDWEVIRSIDLGG